jgi:hypothetical protein
LHESRGDNFTTATNKGKSSAIDAGYSPVKTEGYVFSEKQPGTIPLYLLWSPDREDNFTTVNSDGVEAAKAAGYQFAGVEG